METKAINTKLKGHARVDVADVLRGLAVMGIIILHSIEHFNFYSFLICFPCDTVVFSFCPYVTVILPSLIDSLSGSLWVMAEKKNPK